MLRFLPQSSVFVAILLIGGACARSGDWPNLSDKMPDPTERNRVIERANPSTGPRPSPNAIVSEADASQLLSVVVDAVADAEADFNTAMGVWRQGEGEARTNWMSAQLAVTRLSQTVSRLNEILFNSSLGGTPIAKNAAKIKTQVDALVVAARQELANSKPN